MPKKVKYNWICLQLGPILGTFGGGAGTCFIQTKIEEKKALEEKKLFVYNTYPIILAELDNGIIALQKSTTQCMGAAADYRNDPDSMRIDSKCRLIRGALQKYRLATLRFAGLFPERKINLKECFSSLDKFERELSIYRRQASSGVEVIERENEFKKMCSNMDYLKETIPNIF